MISIVRRKVERAIEEIRGEAKRRGETTPSDVSIEAFSFAASRVEAALAEADRESETLNTEQYAEMHGVTPQSVTLWIRRGELVAERGPNGYRIARDAVRVRKAG